MSTDIYIKQVFIADIIGGKEKLMTSKEFRNSPLFLRNSFGGNGKWEIPIVKRQYIDLDNIELISINDTRLNETETNKRKGVHFFVDDYRFENTYSKPEKSINRLQQYKFVLTPDFSLYSDMPLWRQFESVAHGRWVGANWQSNGLVVIPTISWSTSRSFEFCFDGVEQGATVAVGMIGCKSSRLAFMRGYYEMLNKIQPNAIICLGKPFKEMKGNVISVDYISSRRRAG